MSQHILIMVLEECWCFWYRPRHLTHAEHLQKGLRVRGSVGPSSIPRVLAYCFSRGIEKENHLSDLAVYQSFKNEPSKSAHIATNSKLWPAHDRASHYSSPFNPHQHPLWLLILPPWTMRRFITSTGKYPKQDKDTPLIPRSYNHHGTVAIVISSLILPANRPRHTFRHTRGNAGKNPAAKEDCF